MAIEKLAKIFSFFRKASASEKVLKAIQKGKMPSLYLQNLRTVENPAVRESLTDYVSLFAKKSGGKYQMMKTQVDDITHKLSMCQDPIIRSKAEEILIQAGNKSRKEAFELVSKAEHMLDSVNTANGQYSNLFSSYSPIGRVVNYDKSLGEKLYRDIAKYEEFDCFKVEKCYQDMEKAYSEPRKLFRINNRTSLWEIEEDIMRNEEQFASLREFIKKYPNDKETATYLWKNYFVKTQNAETQKLLNEIYDEYGVRVCLNKEATLKDLAYLKEEFRIWKETSKGEAKFPALFDIREDYFLARSSAATGYTNGNSFICMKHDNIKTTTTRHEIAHLNTNFIKFRGYKRKKPDPKIMKELLNGGVDDPLHFFEAECERIPTIVQCDTKLLSPSFKNSELNRNKKIPRWILDLPLHPQEIENRKMLERIIVERC